jgi:hydrogenase maturation protease
MTKHLLIGIGNSGRQDDGLGWALLDQAAAFFPGDCQYRFQLQLEDAELLSRFDRVLFVDAFKGPLKSGFSWSRVHPQAGTGFSTHLLLPAATLYLCEHLYGRAPRTWLLAIQGYEWDLKEELSPRARENLDQALGWLQTWCGSARQRVALRKEALKNNHHDDNHI